MKTQELIDKFPTDLDIFNKAQEVNHNVKMFEFEISSFQYGAEWMRDLIIKDLQSLEYNDLGIVKLFPTEAEKDIEMNTKADRISHAEHKFGFITGFQYCYEWITKTGVYIDNKLTTMKSNKPKKQKERKCVHCGKPIPYEPLESNCCDDCWLKES
jgi:hypothetical protein